MYYVHSPYSLRTPGPGLDSTRSFSTYILEATQGIDTLSFEATWTKMELQEKFVSKSKKPVFAIFGFIFEKLQSN